MAVLPPTDVGDEVAHSWETALSDRRMGPAGGAGVGAEEPALR